MPCFTKALLAMLLLAAAGCAKRESAPSAPVGPRELTLFYTCDTRGNIHACDCTGGSAGGIARRSSFFRQHNAENALRLDVGNVGAGASERDLIDLDAILEGYRRMGYDAINAGRGEAVLSAAALQARQQLTPALISANLTDEQGALLLASHVIRTLPNGLRVAVTGVLDPALVAGELGAGLRVREPADALVELLASLRKTCDVLVVLAFMEETALIDLASLFYEADVFIGGAVAQPTQDPLIINKTILTSITDRGKSVGSLRLAVDGPSVALQGNEITMLYDSVPADPEVQDILDAHRRRVDALTNATKVVTLEGLQTLPGAGP